MATVTTNGIETYYEEYGEGKPLVVLHGGNSDHILWAELLQPLTDEYRVLVYDLRGHGQSDGSEHDAYTMDLYANDLAAFIDALDLERPAICGLSLGGMIGYTFAIRYPDKLSTLITLGAPSPRTFSYGERFVRVTLLRITTPLMGSERVMGALMWIQQKIFGEDSVADLDKGDRLREEHHCETPDREPKERSKMTRGVLEYIGSELNYTAIEVPVLFMYGENEPYLDEHGEYVAARIPECEVEEIPDAAHNSHLDNSEFIISQLRKRLETTLNGQPQAATD